MEDKRIVLYADEFKDDVWKCYCQVLGVPKDAFSVSLIVSEIKVLSSCEESDSNE